MGLSLQTSDEGGVKQSTETLSGDIPKLKDQSSREIVQDPTTLTLTPNKQKSEGKKKSKKVISPKRCNNGLKITAQASTKSSHKSPYKARKQSFKRKQHNKPKLTEKSLTKSLTKA